MSRVLLPLAGAAVAFLLMSACVAVSIIVSARGGSDAAFQTLGVLLVGFGICAAGLLFAWVFNQGRLRWLMIIGALCGCAAGAAWIVLILDTAPVRHRNDDALIIASTILTVIACGAAYTGWIALLPGRWLSVRLARSVGFCAAWICGASLTALITIETLDASSMQMRPQFFMLVVLFYSAALVTLLSIILLPVSCHLAARRERAAYESVASKIQIDMTCPNCAKPQRFSSGAARCPDCRFLMEIEIEEPRCACGYLLYQLTGDTCPECGREIAAQSRWASQQLQ